MNPPEPVLTTPSDISAAYQAAAERQALRVSQGAAVVGRKIGYTNARLWSAQGVNAPMWGPMYSDTVFELGDRPARHSLAAHTGPRIEPEIAVHFNATPSPASSAGELIQCIDWVAHAYEIVLSPADGHPATAVQAISSGGMHGALLMGPRCDLGVLGRDPLHVLASVHVELHCNGTLIDSGSSSNVMGNPLNALIYLIDGLRREGQPPVKAGDLITTGSMTAPHNIAAGQRWTTVVSGAPLAGLDVSFD